MHFLKKGQTIGAWVDPLLASFGQCPKENVFFSLMSSLSSRSEVKFSPSLNLKICGESCIMHYDFIKWIVIWFNRGEREALLARREFLQQLSLWEEDVKIPLPGKCWFCKSSLLPLSTLTSNILTFPVACYQNDRDRLREFLVSWFQLSAKKQPWYR